MAYVIAEPCIGTKDAACVDACPVDCIHPKKNTTYHDDCPTFDNVPQLYIDPGGTHRLRSLGTGLPGVRNFCPGRPAGEVEAVCGTERKLREGRQIHTRKIRQARRRPNEPRTMCFGGPSFQSPRNPPRAMTRLASQLGSPSVCLLEDHCSSRCFPSRWL
jgi:hypothetical protein